MKERLKFENKNNKRINHRGGEDGWFSFGVWKLIMGKMVTTYFY